ncbi:MAG: sulfatase-like hydrolase/transferase [Pirellulaceae bacterium]|nr:sulfatase-like hydrolase/transferase [Pirellulaceae bacterium]
MPTLLSRFPVLRLFSGLIVLLAFLGPMTTTDATEKPNIIVFLVDDMGPMDTSVPFLTDQQGNAKRYPLNDYYRTPAMERLAAQGTRLNNFYAMSVCSPTRTSILTGQNAARHRVTQWIRSEGNNKGPFGPPDWNWTGFQDAKRTLPGRLKTAGYRTIFIGKAHFGPNDEPSEFPDNLGFDVNIAGCSWGQPGSYYGQDGYGHIKGNKRRAVPHLQKYHGTETFLTEALTVEAKQQIDKAVEDGKPFFLDLALYALHAPFHSNPRYAANYAESGKGKAAQAYATLVESMDTCLNEVMDHVQAKGIARDTLIIFLGDNGSDAPLGPTHQHNSSFPLRAKKGTHYEGGMRAPFIAAWAKPDPNNQWQQKLPIAQGAIQHQLGSVMDLYPTILNLAGVAVPKGHIIDGKDLAQQLTGNRNPDRQERFLMHFPHSHRSSYYTVLRLGQWKVIYHYLPNLNPAKTQYELFNLTNDPFEKTNVAKDHPQVLKRMMSEMVEQLQTQGALYPVDQQGNELRPQVPQ